VSLLGFDDRRCAIGEAEHVVALMPAAEQSERMAGR
jgi:hypothetical protein